MESVPINAEFLPINTPKLLVLHNYFLTTLQYLLTILDNLLMSLLGYAIHFYKIFKFMFLNKYGLKIEF